MEFMQNGPKIKIKYDVFISNKVIDFLGVHKSSRCMYVFVELRIYLGDLNSKFV